MAYFYNNRYNYHHKITIEEAEPILHYVEMFMETIYLVLLTNTKTAGLCNNYTPKVSRLTYNIKMFSTLL